MPLEHTGAPIGARTEIEEDEPSLKANCEIGLSNPAAPGTYKLMGAGATETLAAVPLAVRSQRSAGGIRPLQHIDRPEIILARH